MNVSGKVALVTGAASGIGRTTAKMLAEEGLRGLVILDTDPVGLEKTADLVSGAEILIIQCDVTNDVSLADAYQQMTDHFSALDIVFNNAGIVSGPPPFPDTALARMKRVVDIDLTSVIQSSALAIRFMREHGGGVIINTASTGGLNPYLADAPYAAAKAGVIMFSRSCADLHAQCGIRVNAVCPGVTDTPILEKTGGGKRPDWLVPLLENIQALTPEDIGQAVINIIQDDDMAGEFVVLQNQQKQTGT
jgi:NAD(P)-dependent dehydrogenase (short-subunit alcohol dehydrogenase family)